MKHSLLFILVVVLLATGCEDTALKKPQAEKMIRGAMAKSPYRTVFFYVGPITDEKYLPAYRKVAESDYLSIQDGVFIKQAGREMTVFSLTEKGKKELECAKNRCEAPVCEYRFGKINTIEGIPQSTTVTFTQRLDCDTDMYKLFKPLADMQHVSPSVMNGTAYFQRENETWELYKMQ